MAKKKRPVAPPPPPPARSPWPLIAAVVGIAALVAAVLIGVTALRGGDEPSTAPVVVSHTTSLAGIPQDGAVLGKADAPVTLVEWADLQCPWCAKWATDVLPTLAQEYVKQGKLKIVFRGLAFVGPESELALRAAIAAGNQDKLWDVVETLYHNQGAENAGWVTEDSLKTFGSAVAGLDVEKMIADSSTSAVTQEMRTNAQDARAVPVPGTPFFQLGRTGMALQTFEGGVDPAAFRAGIESLLEA